MSISLKKCLIANRGEIAVRIIRVCRELGIQTVAVYSEVDAHALHVQLADEAYLLGGASPAESYLNIDKLIEVAINANCDCVHPGYGFLSESPIFAQAIIDAELTWVGPNPDAIKLMGVKTEARALMQQANVPLVPGFVSNDESNAPYIEASESIGFPLMVKAAGGGGGKGIRVVYQASELENALDSARREANNAFGDPRVFLEKFIESARHIEVQIIADTHGNTLHLFERECSVQRRHQKIIEETPSPLLTDDTRSAICEAAVKAAQAVNYVNAGTVEFIATEDGEFYFLEMNTRLQVEHPVTELVTNVDLVHLQFLVASGGELPFEQTEVNQSGHAIECRIYAEDPRNNFLPSIGTVHTFKPPQGSGIRVDSGLQSGDEVSIHYDPMIAKIIVHSRTRSDAIRRMYIALQDMVILGTITNRDFLLTLLENPDFIEGAIDTNYVDNHLSTLLPEIPELSDLALIAQAIADHQALLMPSRNNESTQSDGDAYSPWGQSDSFRMSGSTAEKRGRHDL